MRDEPMAWGEAMLSLLTQSGKFYDKLHGLSPERLRARNKMEALRKTREFVDELLAPYAPVCTRFISEATRKLQIQASANGRLMPEGLELRASAGLVQLDWGKSEATETHITMRLIATHAEMVDMPIVVEERVPIT
jgi:hypothetical protein